MNNSAYFVWCPSAGAPTKPHPTVESARDEARRLCEKKENHGKEFFVLRAVESVQYRTDPYVCRNFSKKG